LLHFFPQRVFSGNCAVNFRGEWFSAGKKSSEKNQTHACPRSCTGPYFSSHERLFSPLPIFLLFFSNKKTFHLPNPVFLLLNTNRQPRLGTYVHRVHVVISKEYRTR
jgi:hypothetical protein